MSIKRSLIFILWFLSVAAVSSAASSKFITLTDGSVIKGEILTLNNGVYTIQSENLGEIKLEESKIISISTTAAQAPAALTTHQSSNSSLKAQTQQLQGQLLSDPAVMQEIQLLLEDPEIRKIVSDPTLLNAVMSYDEETIRNNPSIQKLLKNPRILQLMQSLQGQLGQ